MKSVNNNVGMQAKQSQGFVLVLALILMAVMTLIAVSSMNGANIELKATANARQHQAAFVTGESILEYMVSSGALRKDGEILDFQNTDAAPQQVELVINSITVTGASNYAGCTVGVGSSLEEGKGFSYNFFNLIGDGVNATNTAQSTQNQGIRFPAAACNKI